MVLLSTQLAGPVREVLMSVLRTLAVFLIAVSIACSSFGKSIYHYPVKKLGGQTMDLKQYQGHPMLLVNIATQCGYTPQLKGLEAIYQKYKDKGLTVIGIPSNDFGGQTPESEPEVKKFCQLNYGVSFPLTAKTVVKGENKDPLIAELIAQSVGKKEIGWNFEKFLIDANGVLVERFSSGVKPEDKRITDQIEKLVGS